MGLRHLYTSASGIARYAEDDGKGGFIVHSVQKVDDVLENNKRLQNLNDGYSKSRELRRAASIPILLLHAWADEWGFDHKDIWSNEGFKARMMARLNDSDWRYLRTAEGRL
jgi:hypothetical protein